MSQSRFGPSNNTSLGHSPSTLSRRRTVEQLGAPAHQEGYNDATNSPPPGPPRAPRTQWQPTPDRSRKILQVFLDLTPLPTEVIYIILNYARYFCRTHERRLETISVRAPSFTEQFVSRSNGSLLYLRSPTLGQRPLQKLIFVINHEVSFPWAEPSGRTNTSPCAWFEACRYRWRTRRHSVPPPQLRFATAKPSTTQWEEVPGSREILMLETTRGRHTLVTSLSYAESALLQNLLPGEKVGVLAIAGRGTSVIHVKYRFTVSHEPVADWNGGDAADVITKHDERLIGLSAYIVLPSAEDHSEISSASIHYHKNVAALDMLLWTLGRSILSHLQVRRVSGWLLVIRTDWLPSRGRIKPASTNVFATKMVSPHSWLPSQTRTKVHLGTWRLFFSYNICKLQHDNSQRPPLTQFNGTYCLRRPRLEQPEPAWYATRMPHVLKFWSSYWPSTGSISFVSVLLLFAIIGIKYHRASPARRKELFKSHIDVYMFNLFVSELLMSIGGILDVKWAHETQVYCGGYCDVQASFQYLGKTAISIWTLAITIHTGWSVVRAKRLDFRPRFCFGVVVAVWMYVFSFEFGPYVSANPANEDDPSNYFAPTPFCGVGNILVYVPLFLILRRGIVLSNDSDSQSIESYTAPLPPRADTVSFDDASIQSTEDDEAVRNDCWKMLYYPAAYTILVLPLSVVRWVAFANPHFPDSHLASMRSLATAQMTFHVLYRLSGVINVALVLGTRPEVLLLGERCENGEGHPRGADGEKITGGAALPNQRINATQPMERVKESETGFGGPAVHLGGEN
ncbi:hypothetical protein FRC10_011853 [Ceratobasidium sp. 414]|nr:hypothetical protein FRC10_011853 [Ceratobasidium sp. 414]